MKKEVISKTNYNLNSDMTTGISSSVGATIGTMVGNALATETTATEPRDETKPLQEHSTIAVNDESASAANTDNHSQQRYLCDNNSHEERYDPAVSNNSVLDTDIEVLDYQTITYDDGSQVDVAIVNIDGQDMIVADVDMDGKADIIAADLNGNNQLDADEIIDVTSEGISMATFEAAVAADELAQANDYINNADVSDFIA